MKKSLKPGRSAVTVIAAAAVVAVFGGGTAVAATLITSAQIKDNTIRTVDVRNNTLKSADVKDGSLTGTDVGNGKLTGADIADGSLSNSDVGVLFAQVNANATVANSSGGVTALQPFGAGTYEIDFGRDISDCAFVGTVGEAGAGGTSGVVDTATDRLGNPEAVYLQTSNVAGGVVNKPFQLVVVC